jgi:D-serine deaminase-like pyridoxal phosphate-dependent protein
VTRVSSLLTPAVLVDRARLVQNIRNAQALATRWGKSLRPHVKTHKSPVIARWQIDEGARGICCAKVGEAEVFAASGFDDIRLAYPVQPANAARLLRLMERATISIVVDHVDVARAWSTAMLRAGRRLDVLVKVDVGFHRCGVDPERPEAAALVRTIADLPGLHVKGLLSHAGQGYAARSDEELKHIASHEARLLGALKDASEALGVPVAETSVGATPTLRHSAPMEGPTELRPGNYVYFDRTQVGLGAASLGDCALTVLTTVVSTPAKERVILDCGSKTLSSDPARGFTPHTGYGAVLSEDGLTVDESLVIERLSEEHAIVATRGARRLAPGDTVRVVPNHSCVVSNLVDEVWLVEGDDVVDVLPVAARGKIA